MARQTRRTTFLDFRNRSSLVLFTEQSKRPSFLICEFIQQLGGMRGVDGQSHHGENSLLLKAVGALYERAVIDRAYSGVAGYNWPMSTRNHSVAVVGIFLMTIVNLA